MSDLVRVVRWRDGQRTVTLAAPTWFSQERAREIWDSARQLPCWADGLEPVMTDGEMAYVVSILHRVPGQSSFATAFLAHVLGKAPGACEE